MNDYPVTRGARPGDPHLRLRLAALIAVIAGVVLVAAAAFLLSYAGIHQIALQAGVAPALARLYPLMFDAMLVVTCAAVLALRNAGWGTKFYVWVCLLVVLAAVAVGDALHATGVHLTGQGARAAIAVIPWALLLMGFGIWLVMLRQWRRARAAVSGSESSPAGRERPAIEAPAAAAAGAVTWAVAARGAAPARPGAPGVGIDTLLQRDADRAPDRAAATEGAADGTQGPAQGQQRTAEPAQDQPAATAGAAVAGTEAGGAGQNGATATEATGTSPEGDRKDPEGERKDNADARGRRTRLGGLLKLPDSTLDDEESVKVLPAEPKTAEGAGPGKDSEANGAGDQAGNAAQAGNATWAGNTTEAGNAAQAGNATWAGNTTEAGNAAQAGNATWAGNTTEAGNAAQAGNATWAGDATWAGNAAQAGEAPDDGDAAHDGPMPAPLPAAALAPHFDRLRSSPTPPGETGTSGE